MQLIIATKNIAKNNAFTESLKSYKYRHDVKIITDATEEELVSFTAAAYALLFIVKQNGFYAPIIQAMQCGVPVIVSNSILMTEICGEAALFTDPAIFENIADKMMLLFKDENKRNELISKGRRLTAQYDGTETLASLWKTILKSADAFF